jgi:repressor LexA
VASEHLFPSEANVRSVVKHERVFASTRRPCYRQSNGSSIRGARQRVPSRSARPIHPDRSPDDTDEERGVTDEPIDLPQDTDTAMPAAIAAAPDLTARQRSILSMIHTHLSEHGYPPSVREIGDAVGLRSPSSVHAQLESLADKGYLRRDKTKPRALELGLDPEDTFGLKPTPARLVPLLGEIAAGGPIVAEERVDSVFALPRELVGEGELFMLRIRGDSMIEAGVLDGDLVVVREQPTVEQGEMCAALIDGEATVKFFRRTRAGEVFLDPANPSYEPIPLDASQDIRLMGKVVSVMRSVR